MPRRRRDDPFIIEYAQQFESLPWWAGLTAAVLFIAVSFVLPHLVRAAAAEKSSLRVAHMFYAPGQIGLRGGLATGPAKVGS